MLIWLVHNELSALSGGSLLSFQSVTRRLSFTVILRVGVIEALSSGVESTDCQIQKGAFNRPGAPRR